MPAVDLGGDMAAAGGNMRGTSQPMSNGHRALISSPSHVHGRACQFRSLNRKMSTPLNMKKLSKSEKLSMARHMSRCEEVGERKKCHSILLQTWHLGLPLLVGNAHLITHGVCWARLSSATVSLQKLKCCVMCVASCT